MAVAQAYNTADLVAKDRAGRPQELTDRAQSRAGAGDCPFCQGHEDDTTREVAAYRAPGSAPNRPGWRVRVVPNKYPALVPDVAPGSFRVESATASSSGGSEHALFRARPALGVHEVIIESPRHLRSTT